MPREAKPRQPYKMPADDEVVDRLVPIPGWVYKLMARRAAAQQRTTRYQIAFELERLARQLRDGGVKDEDLGPWAPELLEAA